MESGGAAHRCAVRLSSALVPAPLRRRGHRGRGIQRRRLPGVEIEQPDGAGQFESVTLRPHAKLAAGSDENIARGLHDAAAEKCFVARSVSFKVMHEPTFEIASA
jgi:hypothetical protein